jgi:3-methyladenine DNA glycosylase Tag
VNIVLNIVPGTSPDNDAGYLEMMTAVIFMGGLSRQVVMAKWDGFLAAFEEFHVPSVADFTDVDIERLSQDGRIVRYKAKIRAVVNNARHMHQIAAEQGSFRAWLQRMVKEDGVDAAAEELAKRFAYISKDSARNYLYAVGVDIGDVCETIREKYGSAHE